MPSSSRTRAPVGEEGEEVGCADGAVVVEVGGVTRVWLPPASNVVGQPFWLYSLTTPDSPGMICPPIGSAMWLPKDERRLLTAYYRLIGDIEEQKVYRISELCRLFDRRFDPASIHEYGKSPSDDASETDDIEKVKQEIKALIARMSRIKKANRLLTERGLVTVQNHQSEHDVIVVALTVEGYDLGRRYSRWIERTGLWFQEYRNHWVWLVVAFLGGILGSLVLDIIKAADG